VQIKSAQLEFVPLPERPAQLFRAVTRLEQLPDVSEMGIAVAIAAREYQLPFTAIPVFTVRRFDYSSIYFNVESGIEKPADLSGKRIASGTLHGDVDLHCAKMLADCYGVSQDSVHWVAVRDSHIIEARYPDNSEPMYDQAPDLLLESGQVDVLIGGYAGNSPKIRRLLDDTSEAEQWWLSRNRFPPIHHTIVISNDLLRRTPSFAEDLFQGFEEAKRPFVDRLATGEDLWSELNISSMGAAHTFGIARQSDLIQPDPIPYGIEANRGALEAIIRSAVDRGYLRKAWSPEEIFAVSGV